MQNGLQKMTALVTGANAGIGRAIAEGLARRGARVLLAARDRDRGLAARDAIRVRRPDVDVELLLADLRTRDGVLSLAAQVSDRADGLGILVNNAGVFTRRRTVTPDGLETQFAVNHLAPFLLTLTLLDAIRPGGRVVVVSSEAHRRGRIAFDDLQAMRGSYSGVRAYAQSKLANLLFTRELARRTAGRPIVVNAAHPGVVATDLLFRGFPPARLLRPWLKTPEEGARTPLHLAVDPAVAGTSGAYYVDCREAQPSEAARDCDAARLLWEESARLTGWNEGIPA